MKCENCGEDVKVLMDIWVIIQKRWGPEEHKKRVCPDCHELIVSQSFYDEKRDLREQTLNKEERDYVCNLCNLKECPEDCPLKEDEEDYYLDGEDLDELCARCKHIGKVCDPCCPIRQKSQSKQ